MGNKMLVGQSFYIQRNRLAERERLSGTVRNRYSQIVGANEDHFLPVGAQSSKSCEQIGIGSRRPPPIAAA